MKILAAGLLFVVLSLVALISEPGPSIRQYQLDCPAERGYVTMTVDELREIDHVLSRASDVMESQKQLIQDLYKENQSLRRGRPTT